MVDELIHQILIGFNIIDQHHFYGNINYLTMAIEPTSQM